MNTWQLTVDLSTAAENTFFRNWLAKLDMWMNQLFFYSYSNILLKALLLLLTQYISLLVYPFTTKRGDAVVFFWNIRNKF